MREYRLDCKNMTDRVKAHEYMSEVFEFPAWYGKNLDALYDLMRDMGECAVTVVNTDALDSLSVYGEAILATVRDAARENPNIALSED